MNDPLEIHALPPKLLEAPRAFNEWSQRRLMIEQREPTFVRDFLCRFDKIFTLNQDTLLELHYRGSDLVDGSRGRWIGLHTPSLEELKLGGTAYARPGVYRPVSSPFVIRPREQPYLKLHGSSNWRTEDGSSLLIMGGDKSANIEASSLLRWYAEVFRSAVCEPDARLMIIGYGFADPHINAHIRDGAAAGTKLFIIDPNGVDVIRNPQAVRSYNFGGSLDGALIGASRRNLLTTLISDSVERTKVMRFFS